MPDPALTEESLFLAAAELPAAGRDAWLKEQAGHDPELLARVEALFRAVDAVPEFMADPRPPVGAQTQRIGSYELLEKLGEGGFGTVWLARQLEPVRREVALKILRGMLHGRESALRFEAEKQALARMEHPGIARVFDAGTTALGEPWLSMELVRGMPLVRWCDEHSISIPERLRIFCCVCDAVQHAHQKGVLHRDLKPSNILVTGTAEAGIPVVIDFGIAKALEGSLADVTLLTSAGQIVGTPQYMSPEQALDGQDVDTRSDVYSLGAVLYELLAGRPPIEMPASTRPATVIESMRRLRDETPPRPSDRVTQLGEAGAPLAASRAVPPERFAAAVRGDLDWICMRALEKERERRYASAAELGEDVRRHLRGEPVLARPPSWSYVTGRFVRRHRVAVAAATAVAAAVLAGTAISVQQAVKARRAERQTATALEQSREHERTARQAYQAAEQRIEFMTRDLGSRMRRYGQLALLNDVFADVARYYSGRQAAPDDPQAPARQIRFLLGWAEAMQPQGLSAQALEHATAASTLAAESAARYPSESVFPLLRAESELSRGLALSALGREAEAVEVFTRAAALLPGASPDEIALQIRFLSAESQSRSRMGDGAAALSGAARAAALLQRLPPEQASQMAPDVHVLSGIVRMEEADRVGEKEPARTAALLKEALASFVALEQHLAPRAAQAQDDRSLQRRLAESLSWQAAILRRQDPPDFSAARQRLARERDVIQPMADTEPVNGEWQNLLISNAAVEGEISRRLEQHEEAARWHLRTRELAARLIALRPTVRQWWINLSNSLVVIGMEDARQGDNESAWKSFLQSLEAYWGAMCISGPLADQRGIFASLTQVAKMVHAEDHRGEAAFLATWAGRFGAECARQPAADQPRWRHTAALLLCREAAALIRAGEHAQAAERRRAALAHWKEALAQPEALTTSPDIPAGFCGELPRQWRRMTDHGRPGDMIPAAEEWLQLLPAFAAAEPQGTWRTSVLDLAQELHGSLTDQLPAERAAADRIARQLLEAATSPQLPPPDADTAAAAQKLRAHLSRQ